LRKLTPDELDRQRFFNIRQKEEEVVAKIATTSRHSAWQDKTR
jgi:hypothetical protein